MNGRLLPPDAPCLPADDRGWTLGDGVFETIRAHAGRPVLLDAHLQRLQVSAALLRLMLPPAAQLADDVARVLTASQLEDAVVRLSVSRGTSQRGLGTAPGQRPNVLVAAQPFTPYPPRWYAEGVHAVVATVVRNERSPLAGAKSLSYAEQVLARLDAQERGADLGLMFNTQGRLASADSANLFVVRAGQIMTPPLAEGALPGTVRRVLLEQGQRAGWQIVESSLREEDLLTADEAFVTNVLLEVAPLVRVGNAKVGDGMPGPVATRLRRAYREAVGLGPPPVS